MRQPRIHNLRAQLRERSPDLTLFLDVETDRELHPDHELQTFRLGHLRLDRRHDVEPDKPRTERWTFYSLDSLTALLGAVCPRDRTVSLYAYNAMVELKTTRLPVLLEADGWKVGKHLLYGDPAWGYFQRGRQRLFVGDAASWLPGGIWGLGERIGLPKLPLPEWEDSDEVWAARCERDVDIMAVGLLECMDWWDRERLGGWSITGPATGLNSYRHRYLPHGPWHRVISQTWAHSDEIMMGRGLPVIHPPGLPKQRARAAIYGGRRECWHQGTLPPGSYAELDFERAHLTIAAERRLPWRHRADFDAMPLDWPHLEDVNLGVIAECELETEVPRYPLRTESGTVYPVGRFRTTLCTPEILEAKGRGELVSIGSGSLYMMSWHMADWAKWVASVLEEKLVPSPPAVKIMAKAWARTVPGKWAGWTSEAKDVGQRELPDWWLQDAGADRKGRRQSLAQIGRTVYLVTHDLEPDNGAPEVLAFVQSYLRVELGRLVDAIGQGAMLSCNTDAVLFRMGPAELTPEQRERVIYDPPSTLAELAHLGSELSTLTDPLRLAPKGLYRRLRIYSGQHRRVDGKRVMAGVPYKAVEIRPDVFEGEAWPRLGEQLKHGDSRGLVVRTVVQDFSDVAVNRWRYDCGCCKPVRARVRRSGRTQILVPDAIRCPEHGAGLKPRQWPEMTQAMARFWGRGHGLVAASGRDPPT